MSKYKTLKINGKKIDEHRHVMQLHLGRKLLRAEIVRHRDKNILNNTVENLYIVTRSEQFKEQIKEGLITTGRVGKIYKVRPPKEKAVKVVKVPKIKKINAVIKRASKKVEPRFETKNADTSKLVSLRLDKKTIVYVKPDISQKEKDRIIDKHKNYINIHMLKFTGAG